MSAQRILIKTPELSIVHCFWSETDNFDLAKKNVPCKRPSQEEQNSTISALRHLPLWSKRTATNELNFGQNALL